MARYTYLQLDCFLLDDDRPDCTDLMCVVVVKMSVEDITKLVRSNRKFDLLVVGLQEAPKCDVSQVLQETMADTHM